MQLQFVTKFIECGLIEFNRRLASFGSFSVFPNGNFDIFFEQPIEYVGNIGLHNSPDDNCWQRTLHFVAFSFVTSVILSIAPRSVAVSKCV